MRRGDIIKKAHKLQALAERGVGGEKDNAERKLREYLKKHGMEEQDLLARTKVTSSTKIDDFRYEVRFTHIDIELSFGTVRMYNFLKGRDFMDATMKGSPMDGFIYVLTKCVMVENRLVTRGEVLEWLEDDLTKVADNFNRMYDRPR